MEKTINTLHTVFVKYPYFWRVCLFNQNIASLNCNKYSDDSVSAMQENKTLLHAFRKIHKITAQARCSEVAFKQIRFQICLELFLFFI